MLSRRYVALFAVVITLGAHSAPASAAPGAWTRHRTVEVGGQPVGVHYLRSQRVILAVNAKGWGTFVDGDSLEVSSRTRWFSSGLFESVVTPDERWLLTWSYNGARLHFVDLKHRQYDGFVKLGRNLGDAVVLPGGDQVLVTAVASQRALLVDIASREVQRRIRFRRGIGFAAVAPGGELAVATGGIYHLGGGGGARGSHIYLFEPRERLSNGVREVRSLDSGRHPRGAFFSADGRWLLATNQLESSVSLVDVGRETVIEHLETGAGPEELLPSLDGDEVLSINRRSPTLTRISLSRDGRSPVVTGTIHLPGKPYRAQFLPSGDLAVAILGRRVITPVPYVGGVRLPFPLRMQTGHPRSQGERRDALAFVYSAGDLVDVVPLGRGPVDLDVRPDGQEVAVACALSRSIAFVEWRSIR